MAKLEKIKQYKIQGSSSLLEELVNYPKRRGPKVKPEDADAQAKKLETRNRYEQWLQTCKWNMDMAKTQYGPPGSQLVEQSKKRRRSKGSKQKWT